MRIDKTRLLYLLTAVAVSGFLTCCDDCPNCPGDQIPEAVNYRLYVHDDLNRFLVSIDVPADTIVDSVRLNFYGFGIGLTPDYQRLLVNNVDEYRTEIFDPYTLELIGNAPIMGDYYFDATDNIGICCTILDSVVYKIDPVSLVPIDSFKGPDIFGEGYLDTTNNTLMLPLYLDAVLYVIDYIDWAITDSIYLNHTPKGLVVSPDQEIIYYHARIPGGSAFFRYEIATDTEEYLFYTYGPFGSSVLSPDRQSVYVTDGGDGAHGDIPRGEIRVLDVATGNFEAIISPYDYSTGERIPGPCLGPMINTPDTRRCYVGAAGNAWGRGSLAAIDNYNLEIISVINPFPAFEPRYLTIGPAPTE